MSYHVDFAKGVRKIIKKWKKSNPNLYGKLYYDILP